MIGSISLVRLSGVFLSSLSFVLLGCSGSQPSTNSLTGAKFQGSVYGGQQPVSGATIRLYAAATTGYGAAATSLLTSPVVTDANGSFSITGDYTCPNAASQLFIVATGGNPGLPTPGTNNSALALMAALGPCALRSGHYTLDPNLFISINETTTVASVYALSAFMGGDATHVGTSSTNAVGLANSFEAVNNLVNITTGAALAKTPAGNGVAPQGAIDTLGNILSACVNSDGTGAPCGGLFAATTPTGGTAPTDTIQALFNIARSPANNVGILFALSPPSPPFQPTLSSVPNDWTLGVTYTGGLSNAHGMAIDGSGNVWIANNGTAPNTSSVLELSNTGTVLSGPSGYTGGGMSFALGIAIDPSGNAWVSAYGNSNVVELSPSGVVLSGANGYTGGGLNTPNSIAIDGAGNAWVSDIGSKSIIELNNSGTILSGPSGFSGGGLAFPTSLAIDGAGSVWVQGGANNIVKLSNSGAVLSGSMGYSVKGGGPEIDASGNVWLSGAPLFAAYELNSAGLLLSPAGGYPTCVPPSVPTVPARACNTSFGAGPLAIDGSGNVFIGTANTFTDSQGHLIGTNFGVAELNQSGTIISGPSGYGSTGQTAFAIDGSGNLWSENAAGNNLTELIGVATPVVTPYSVGVKNGTLGSRP
jgi:hypothetical protein